MFDLVEIPDDRFSLNSACYLNFFATLPDVTMYMYKLNLQNPLCVTYVAYIQTTCESTQQIKNHISKCTYLVVTYLFGSP